MTASNKTTFYGFTTLMALIAACGMSLPIWYTATGNSWIVFAGIAIFYPVLDRAVPHEARGRQLWAPTALLMALALIGIWGIGYIFGTFFPGTAATPPLLVIQQVLLFIYFFLTLRFILPRRPLTPKTQEEPATAPRLAEQ